MERRRGPFVAEGELGRLVRDGIVGRIRTWPGGSWLLARYLGFRLLTERRLSPNRRPHRGYVGGMWEEIGNVQYEFLLRRGLTPDDVLVDIACGSLRGGRLFIPYLAPGHYLGLDHNAWLIRDGLRYEVPSRVIRERRPEFVVSDSFEFDKFSLRPTYGIAQSLFSHLTKDDVRLCLDKLRASIEPTGRFYATFIPIDRLYPGHVNPSDSADEPAFAYKADELLLIGRDTGWKGQNLGQWGHPRGQEMIEFRPES